MENLAIDRKYYPGLSRLFSPSVMNELIRNDYSGFFEEIISVSGLDSIIDHDTILRDFLQMVYKYLLRHYRSEYIYKNAIINKILLGKHSLNTAFMLTEFRVADCKADAVILNGTSNVYEIKSELDSMDRLNRQIAAYEQVFDLIHIIAAPSQIKKIEALVPKHIGIMRLSKNTISTIREPQSRKTTVDPKIIFDSLRKSEYTSILKQWYGSVPDVPNTMVYKTYRELFGKLSPETAHGSMVKTLKKRGECKRLRDFIQASPEYLRAYTLNSGLNREETNKFKEILNTECRNFLGSNF